MVNEMRFYYKDYKNAIQIQGINPTYDIDFYFSSKKQYEQFKEDYSFSQSSKLDLKQEGRVEGAKTELQNCIKDLEASLEFYECDYGKFEQKVVDKVIEELTENINKFKKRLKELKKGGKV